MRKINDTFVLPIRSPIFGQEKQIRSYIIDKSFAKDLRTGLVKNNLQAVLDGDIDDFLKASLASRVKSMLP